MRQGLLTQVLLVFSFIQGSTMETFPEFVVFQDPIGFGSQDALEFTLRHRGRLRDQYANNSIPKFIPDVPINYIVSNIIVHFLNSTMVTGTHPAAMINTFHPGTYPEILPQVEVFSMFNSVYGIWETYYTQSSDHKRSVEPPTFIKKKDTFYNFVMCDRPRHRFDSTWKFSIFTSPFDIWTWLVLSILLILVSLVVSYSSRHGFFHTFLTALAALLDNEMTHITTSKLYLLWLFATLLICDFYSGEVTSQVIAPPEEDVLFKTFEDVEKNNFTIIFPNSFLLFGIKTTVQKLSQASYVQPNVATMMRLLETSRIVNKFSEALASDPSVASVLGWSHSMMIANLANAYFANETKKMPRNKRKKLTKCHVGEEMLDVGEVFIILQPPGSIRMAQVYDRLIQSGIFQRWNDELQGILHSARVQDRTKIKNETRFAKEQTIFKHLRMEGKMVTVFKLGSFCLIISFLAFCSEKLHSIYRQTNVMSLELAYVNAKDDYVKQPSSWTFLERF